jgi:hypothetical protein
MATICNIHDDDALNRLPPVRPARRPGRRIQRIGETSMNIRLIMIVAVALLVTLTPTAPGLATKGAFVLAFVPPQVQHYSASPSRRHHPCVGRNPNQQSAYTPTATKTLLSQQSPGECDSDEQQQQQHPQDIWVINWEGCVVDTVPWRIQTGLETASRLWPHCRDLLSSSSSTSWLSNRLAAVSHVLCEPPPLSSGDSSISSSSVSVAYTLAVRLFLEEQELDQGRSVGSRGKYGSQYHPQQEQEEQLEEEEKEQPNSRRTNRGRGSRPLTVGEVGANWYDGACLCDTLPIKYRCPPLVLQEAVHETIATIKAREEEEVVEAALPNHHQLAKLLTVRTSVLDILVQAAATDPDKKILLTVSHPSDLATAQACLESALRGLPSDLLPCDLNVASNATDAMITRMNNNSSNSKNTQIVLLPKSARTIQDLLQTAPADSTVHVLESSWQALQREIPLFGDHVPVRGPAAAGGDLGTCSTSNLELVAADWAHADDNTPLERAAVMSPWTRLLSLTELEECITARIVRASTTNE